MSALKVLKVFNNNVVLARDELGREVVITGRGAGYQARPGGAIDEALIIRRFVPADNPDSVAKVLADIPPERLALVETLFAEAMRNSARRYRRWRLSQWPTTCTRPSSGSHGVR